VKKSQVFTILIFSVLLSRLNGQVLEPDLQPGKSAPQSHSLSINLKPALGVPLGKSADYFKLGTNLDLNAEYLVLLLPQVLARGAIVYALAPLKAEESISLIAPTVGAALGYQLSPRWTVKGNFDGGYYYGFFNKGKSSTSGGGMLVTMGAEVGYLLNPLIDLGLGVSYRNYLGLVQGLVVHLGTSFYITGRSERQAKIQSTLPVRPGYLRADARLPGKGSGIELKDISLQPVFPVFYAYYDDHPLGSVVVYNAGSKTASDVSVRVYINQYMDAPKECATIAALSPGESRQIDLTALFTEKVLEITEGTKVVAEIIFEYRLRGDWYGDAKRESLRILDRNAMTWEDDRRAAAFVTAKDPSVMSFSKNVVGSVRDVGNQTVDENLRKAIALHEALNLYGISYVVDPKTPYTDFAQKKNQVDYLQFPRQTLEYKAGDCDDLSILFSALLESVGVETAFITVPGHIFMAFSLDVDETAAKKSFSDPGKVIFFEGQAWIPVEITLRQSFAKAWEEGVKEWKQFQPGSAGFHPIHRAWGIYEPVGLPGSGPNINVPVADALKTAYNFEVDGFIDREIAPQVAELQKAIQGTKRNESHRNRLGVLYARYGKYAEASAEFEKLMKQSQYTPAVINLGNIAFQEQNWNLALEYYTRAQPANPNNPVLLLNLARVHQKLANFGLAEKLYVKAKALDPQLAARYSYLEVKSEEGAKAAESGRGAGGTIWAED